MADKQKKKPLKANVDTLQELADAINAKLGEEVLVLGSRVRKSLPRTSSGILALDLSLGGGFPLNQWIEIVGEESSGKTALALSIIASRMKEDPDYTVIFVAAEEFVREYAEAIGVDMERCWVIESNQMEVALEVVLRAVDNRLVDAVVIDSIPALVTETEMEKEAGDASVATGAQILSRFFKKAAAAQRRSMLEGVEDRDVLLIAINQYRDKIGQFFGDPKTTPGGKAKNYFFFIRMETRRDEWITDGSTIDKRVGQMIALRIFKNKTYRPHQYASVDFYFADTDGFKKGDIDKVRDVVNTCLALDVFEGMYKFDGVRIARKKEDLYGAVREDIGLYQALYAAAIEKALPQGVEDGSDGVQSSDDGGSDEATTAGD